MRPHPCRWARRHARVSRGRLRVAVTASALLGLLAVPAIAAMPGAPGAAAARADGVVGGAMLGQPGFAVHMAPDVPPLPPTTATSFIVADADTGRVLAAHNAHDRLAPASTLKTLTALALLPRLSPDFASMAQPDAPRVDGTKAGIVAGNLYRVDQLFTAMLMMSANDAAVALADANGGQAATLDEMNAEAAHLQAFDTVAKTPDGLDAPGQSSSAYDLALIFRAGLSDFRFRHYLALSSASFAPVTGQNGFQIQTHDKLLAGYPGMLGGKNGYTVAAQASYVGAATRGGHTIIVAVMRDQPNFWNEVKALLDWGFSADSVASPVGTLVPPVTPGMGGPAKSGGGKNGPAGAGGVTLQAGGATAAVGASASNARSGAGHSAGHRGRHGVPIGEILTDVAVGIGALVFVLTFVSSLARRRRLGAPGNDDDQYRAALTGLAGLSRLSTLQQVGEQPSPSESART